MKKPIKQVDGHLYRSSRPDGISDLTVFGNKMDIVVCLQSGMYEALTQDDYEDVETVLGRYGITRYNIRCSDIVPPSREKVRDVMSIFYRYAFEGKNVLVHCLSGVDRTGYMVAAYRMIRQGWTYKQAKAEYIAEGQHFWYRWWIPSLKKYEKKGV